MGERILVTGGAGSIGSSLVRKLSKSCDEVRAFDINENDLFKLRRSLSGGRVKFILGDIRDRWRVHEAVKGVNLILHCAALKHVPMGEDYPVECIKTNVGGTENLVREALEHNVEKLIFISSDKAVYPTSVYGMTKFLGEKIVLTNGFSVVRLPNVWGTKGSVAEIWNDQLARGEPLTVTDKRMRRFFISMEEAVKFILLSAETARGGEIFVPRKVEEKKILDLAKERSKDIKVIGRLPGEKLFHELMTDEEKERAEEMAEEMGWILRNDRMFRTPRDVPVSLRGGNFSVEVHEPTYIHSSARIGKGTKVGAFCDIGKNVKIGNNCNIQCHVTISNGTKIGNQVFIGPNSSLLNRKYPISPKNEPPIVEDNVVIGGGCIILPGVRLRKGCVVGAGSVVTNDVPEEIVVWGNPASPRSTRREYEEKRVEVLR